MARGVASGLKRVRVAWSKWLSFESGIDARIERIENSLEGLPLVTKVKNALPGWKLDVGLGIALAVTALVFNIIFLVTALSQNKPSSNGLGILHKGDCSSVNWWNRILHAIINIASTLLFQQSNYCMQMLASPTRREVNAAHKRREWVEIGIHSFRNVWKRSVNFHRVCLWWLLATSSILLHLLWNSMVLSSPTSYEYVQLTVHPSFVTAENSFNAFTDVPSLDYASLEGALFPDNLAILQNGLNNTAVWEHLEPSQCVQEYRQNFLNSRSDVVVVVTGSALQLKSSSVVGAAAAGFGPWPYQWICPDNTFACDKALGNHNKDWQLTFLGPTYQVSYCLSKKMKTQCSLDYAYLPTILVIASNVAKLLCFCATYWLLSKSDTVEEAEGQGQTLLTSGDAIASFLKTEDETTRGMCLAEKADFENGIWDIRWVDVKPMRWSARATKAWFRAVGLWRWLAFIVLLLAIPMASGIILLSHLRYLRSVGLSARTIWDLGLGNPAGQMLFGTWTGGIGQNESDFLGDAMIANSPQLLLSVGQFWWTSQLVCMLAARDFDKFAARSVDDISGDPKAAGEPLRVSEPVKNSQQRRVGMALRFWLLTTFLWTLVPWLASQAIFYAKIDVLDHWLYPTDSSISQVGYSVLGLLLFTAASFVVFLLAVALGSRRLRNQIPLSGTCSAAISAACHPGGAGVPHHERKVRWGVDGTVAAHTLASSIGTPYMVRRTAFTSNDVEEPEDGEYYA